MWAAGGGGLGKDPRRCGEMQGGKEQAGFFRYFRREEQEYEVL